MSAIAPSLITVPNRPFKLIVGHILLDTFCCTHFGKNVDALERGDLLGNSSTLLHIAMQ